MELGEINSWQICRSTDDEVAIRLYIIFFEAAVVNYPMHLNVDVEKYKLSSLLVPNAIGDKAYFKHLVFLLEQL
jgi:hypothetical protein